MDFERHAIELEAELAAERKKRAAMVLLYLEQKTELIDTQIRLTQTAEIALELLESHPVRNRKGLQR